MVPQEPAEWHDFAMRYLGELEDNSAIGELVDLARTDVATLLCASANEDQNDAAVLREHLQERLGPNS